MNKHELFDLIGEADEDYVLAADRPVKRARPRWQIWAACAACAALALCAYPIWKAAQPHDAPLYVTIPLHSYTVVEDGASGITTWEHMKAPVLGSGEEGPEPDPMPDPPDPGPDMPFDPDDTEPVQGPPDQSEAIAQYDNLMRNGGISYYSGGSFPAWYGGAWLDNDWPDNTARLTVAVMDGFRTPEMEAQILEWCGGTGDVLFCDAKYSYDYLQNLMERINRIDESLWTGTHGSHGVDVTANCVGVDIFGDAAPESLLAALAELDPDGDAIRVQVHTGQTINTYIEKGPAPDRPAADPVAPEDRADPIDGSAVLPGGAQEDSAQETPPDGEETGVPAQYDAPSGIIELPEAKDGPLPLEE